ncbi:hypothetical protein M5K25_007851 [Dendrobium thyrsiflorum]|uniref:Fungal lipase-like domain-containing protein n=1 Tax=Dendrobium thyrsiflorum TaxID=117978 RepID=A0ABD0VFV7_DENTH
MEIIFFLHSLFFTLLPLSFNDKLLFSTSSSVLSQNPNPISARHPRQMPAACCGGLECVLCATCARWAWRRCSHAGAHDSASWPPASASDFAPIPRACRAILASYEDDLSHPRWAPTPFGYRIDPSSVIRRATYADTADRCPPYLIYFDRYNSEVVLAVRGLNLGRGADYRLLLDNRPEPQRFDGGYVHRGLLKAAVWVLNREAETLRRVLMEAGPECRLVFAGHSLGAGVAAMMAAVAVNCLDRFGGIGRERVRCYAVAPARCMSIDLAVKYADVIHSVVLQDDFLPRTPTPLEHIFGSIFCLPCLLFLVCMRDTFMPEVKMLKDPKRLYAPGRIYHIIERRPCSCGRMPPDVKTAIPVEGRFEHIVLSCNAMYDHSLVWIEREAQKALDRMQESYDSMIPPTQPIIVRDQSLDREYKYAVEKTAHLKEPYEEIYIPLDYEQNGVSYMEPKSDWEELVEKLFNDDDEAEGHEVMEKSSNRDVNQHSLLHTYD